MIDERKYQIDFVKYKYQFSHFLKLKYSFYKETKPHVSIMHFTLKIDLYNLCIFFLLIFSNTLKKIYASFAKKKNEKKKDVI